MEQSRDPPAERKELAAEVKAIVESDTDTLVDAVSRGEITALELETLCKEATDNSAEIDGGVLELVRIITTLLAQRSEHSDDPASCREWLCDGVRTAAPAETSSRS
ncbi:hypothetical protein ABNG03_03365 [Halorubrum sp. RMP-47]|uniref:Uncharacterized protein n=1 Tax=Halorubrum miltondacostae TaxID=3076378 RepID=A0ABD5M5S8_9EURY